MEEGNLIMQSRYKSSKGVITVLISLLLVGVLSVGTLSIEAGRFQAAKTQLAESNISAATSMLAAYNTDLFARYGLLAIDTENFTTARAADYLTFNADQAAGYRGNRLSRMYAVDNVELTGLYNLTYPTILRRQVLSRAKYHVIPQNYTLNIDNIDAFLIDLKAKSEYIDTHLWATQQFETETGSLEDIPADIRTALAAMYAAYPEMSTWDKDCDVTLSNSTIDVLPSTTGTVESEVPEEDLEDIQTALNNAESVLGPVGGILDYTQRDPAYNQWSFDNGNFFYELLPKMDASFLTLATGDFEHFIYNHIPYYANWTSVLASLLANPCTYIPHDEKEEYLLLNSYIVDTFSNRDNTLSTYAAPQKGTSVNGTMDNATFSSACVEYIMNGSASEKENQEYAYYSILATRFVYNLYMLMTESESFNENNMCSVAAHMAWAYYESLIDTELVIKHGVAVPLNKERMILPINSAGTVAAAFAAGDMESALDALGFFKDGKYQIPGIYAIDYTNHMMMGLWYTSDEKKMMRLADMIQLEIRYREQYVDHKTPTFMMADQNTYCRIKCTGKFSAVLPMMSADTGNSARGYVFQSIKYAGY